MEESTVIKKYRRVYTKAQTQTVLSKFQDRYVDKEKLKKYMLMWNSFRQKPRCLPFERISQLGIPLDMNVFFYDERNKVLLSTTLEDIIDAVEGFQPWEGIDAYVFEDNMNWVIAITHEDNLILCLGL
jgi:hypothetical protein